MSPSEGVAIGTPEDLALDGTLARFFVREGIRFDKHSGLFRIEFACSSHVRLIGKGQRYTLMRKALRRDGIEASREVESEYSVRVDDTGYRLCRNAEPIATAGSIGEMIAAIRAALLRKEATP